VFLVKFATGGSLSWQRTWDGPDQFGNDRANGVAVAPDGSVYVTGSTLGVRGDVLLLKFSPEGSLVWQRRWDGGATESGEAVAVASDGSVYVTGGTNSFTDSGHLFVLRFAPDGTLVWQRIRADATGEGIAVDPAGEIAAVHSDGRILIGGETASFGAGSDDAFLLQMDASGKGIACNSWGGQDLDHGDDVEVAPDGTIVLGATTRSSPPFTFADCPRQTKRLHGTVATPAVALADAAGAVADPNGTVATPNGSSPGAGGFDAALVRITP
jgi:hypothetical protein